MASEAQGSGLTAGRESKVVANATNIVLGQQQEEASLFWCRDEALKA